MAVTAVTITSFSVAGRSVSISGTYNHDGGGTNNQLLFVALDQNSNGTTITPLVGSSTLDTGVNAGTAIAFGFSGALPEGNWGVINVYRIPSVTLMTTSSSSVGLIQLRKPLAGVWTPRRDARGLFVPKADGVDSPLSSTAGGISPRKFHYNYPVSGSDGIYTTVLGRIIRTAEASFGGYYLRSVNTPYGAGIDAKTGWQFGAYPVQGGGWSVPRQTWVSLFYIYDASKFVTNYPRFFGNVGNNPVQRGQTICWINTTGEQALVVSSDIGFSGGEVLINGVGNGLHCMVVTSVGSTAAGSVRVFLDGQLVTTTTGPSGWNGATFPTTDFFAASISQSGSNVGNILFNALFYGYVANDSEAAALSLDPYRYFFRDAPSTSLRAVRNMTFDGNTYQSSRPTADVSNAGWVRVP